MMGGILRRIFIMDPSVKKTKIISFHFIFFALCHGILFTIGFKTLLFYLGLQAAIGICLICISFISLQIALRSDL